MIKKIILLVFVLFLSGCFWDNVTTDETISNLYIYDSVDIDGTVNKVKRYDNFIIVGLDSPKNSFIFFNMSTFTSKVINLPGPVYDFTFFKGDLIYSMGNRIMFVNMDNNFNVMEIYLQDVTKCSSICCNEYNIYAEIDNGVIGIFSKTSFSYEMNDTYTLLSTDNPIVDLKIVEDNIYILVSSEFSSELLKNKLSQLNELSENIISVLDRSFALEIIDKKIYIGTDNGLISKKVDLNHETFNYIGEKITGICKFNNKIALSSYNYGIRCYAENFPETYYLLVGKDNNSIASYNDYLILGCKNKIYIVK